MPTPTITSYAVFAPYPWDVCSFLKENGGGVGPGKRVDVYGELGGVEGGKIVVGTYCIKEG